VTRNVDERLSDILIAIARARVADERMNLAESQGDDAGVRIAFVSSLHNLFVIGEAVKALPPKLLDSDLRLPGTRLLQCVT
jgi:uncharacterized protein with HEPN domain